jgi:tetratricopeptide (TPR) repeat protein
MAAAAASLGALLVGGGAPRGRVVWDADGAWPEPPLALGVPVPRLLWEGQRRVFPGAASRAAWAARRREAVEVRPPDDAPDAAWGLSPAALRLVRDGARADTLGDLVAAARGGETDEVWSQVHHLLVLGMLELRLAVDDAPPPVAPDDDIAVEVVSAAPGGAAAAADPRLAELRAAVDALLGANAAERLEILAAADATEDGLQRSFRAVSARYHPDRFHGAAPAVAELAARAFSLVGEARDALLVGNRLRDLRERLAAKAEGRVYVSDDDRRRAKVKLTHAEAAARKLAFVEAHTLYGEAHRLDPLDWVAEAGMLRAGWKAGVVDGVAAAARLPELKPATARERGDLLALAGEMLLRAGRAEEAYPLLDKAVQLCPDHIDARRHLRLRDMRSRPEEKVSLLDNLKGLFKPRGGAAPAPAEAPLEGPPEGPLKR